jgi:hypothetical protein
MEDTGVAAGVRLELPRSPPKYANLRPATRARITTLPTGTPCCFPETVALDHGIATDFVIA